MASACTMGIDLGGTKILAALLDYRGKVLAHAKSKTMAEGGVEVVLERIAETARDLLKSAKLSSASVDCIGIGSAGLADPITGQIIESPNLPFDHTDLRGYVSKRLKRPVYLLNDVNAGAWGEAMMGAGKGFASSIGVFVGTGIGGGLILKKDLFEGAGRMAGEIGHMCLNPEGPVCGCGRRGCLEAYASRTAITRNIWEAIGHGETSVITQLVETPGVQLRSSVIRKAYELDDPLVRQIVDDAADWLGIALGCTANLLNPECIVLGGGVVEALGKRYVDRIRESMRKHCFQAIFESTKLAQAILGDDAGVIGAALLARRAMAAEAKSGAKKAASEKLIGLKKEKKTTVTAAKKYKP